VTSLGAATGVQVGLSFLAAARRDELLRRELEEAGDDITEDQLCQIAKRAGFGITACDLQEAHALDWRMRHARYTAGGETI
jgi:hypothetical protein